MTRRGWVIAVGMSATLPSWVNALAQGDKRDRATVAAGAPGALDEAEHAPFSTILATWERLPAVERAASAAVPTPLAVRAWGDRGRGCYALTLTADGAKSVAGSVNALRASLGATASTLPAAQGETYDHTAPIEVGKLRGAVRVSAKRIGDARARLDAVSCSFNDREPAICEALCKKLLAEVGAHW